MSQTVTDEEIRAAQRAYKKEWDKKNRDKLNTYQRNWRNKNKDKVEAARKRYWTKKILAEKEKQTNQEA